MGIALNIVFVLIILVFAGFAFKKGIAATIAEILAFVLAIFCAAQVAAPVANMIYDNNIEPNIKKAVEDKLPEEQNTATNKQKADYIVENIPNFILTMANGMGITKSEIAQKIEMGNFDKNTTITTIIDTAVKPIAIPILKSIIFIIFAAVFVLLLRFLAKMITNAGKDDDKKITLNNILGCLLGIAKGLVVVYLICAVLQILAYSDSFQATAFAKALPDSTIFVWMTDKNPIIEAMKNIY